MSTMRRFRSPLDDCESWARDGPELPPYLRREQVPAALIGDFSVTQKLRSLPKHEPIWRAETKYVSIIHEYIVTGLVDTFADAFERAMTRQKSYSKAKIADLKARAQEIMMDIVGRFLYLRLYNIAVAKGLDREDFESTPTMNPNIQLPTPLARAISDIGVFKPAGVDPGTTFLPSYGRDPGLAGGYKDRCQSQAYSKLLPEFAKCGIATSQVEVRNSSGTSWYLLGVKEIYENDGVFPPNLTTSVSQMSDDEMEDVRARFFDVIATFPPEYGNISVTDVITRTYCLHKDEQRYFGDCGHQFIREHVYIDMMDCCGANFGTALAGVKYFTEPIHFMEVDMATEPESVLLARDRKISETANRKRAKRPVTEIDRGV